MFKPQKKRLPFIKIENAQIFARNFSGKAGQFNADGQRNFCLILNDADAEMFKTIGFNVKYLKPRDPQETPKAFVQVKVNYGEIPPKIELVTKKNKTLLNAETVSILDYAEIENVDLTINPSVWEVNGKTGVKPYVRSMFVTIVEDDLDDKYSNVPDSAVSSMDEP